MTAEARRTRGRELASFGNGRDVLWRGAALQEIRDRFFGIERRND